MQTFFVIFSFLSEKFVFSTELSQTVIIEIRIYASFRKRIFWKTKEFFFNLMDVQRMVDSGMRHVILFGF